MLFMNGFSIGRKSNYSRSALCNPLGGMVVLTNPFQLFLTPMNFFKKATPERLVGSRLGLFACVYAGSVHAVLLSDSSRTMPFRIGVQMVDFRFTGLGQTDADGNALSYRGVMPAVGYQFNRRLSVELSAIWRGKDIPGKMTVVDYPNGGLYRYYDSYNSRVIPFVVRYSLFPRLRKWGVEGVAGLVLLHSRVEGNRSMTEPGQPLQPFSVGGFTEANDLPLILGTAITYSPTPHWTVRGEGRINWSWLGSTAGAILFGGVFLPQTGLSVGVNYNFGLHQ